MDKIKYVLGKVRWGSFAHTLQNIALPALLLLLVTMELVEVAVLMVIISKWRMFAVQPHHWWANIRTSSADLIVGISSVFLMIGVADVSERPLVTLLIQVLITLLYTFWLIVLKPGSTKTLVGIQAFIAHTMGFMVLFWYADSAPELLLVAAAWFIAQTTARHFLKSFDDQFSDVLALAWALFAVQLSWVINRWHIGYEVFSSFRVSNGLMLMVIFSYSIGSLYSLWMSDKLSLFKVRQFSGFMILMILALIILTDWSGAV